MRSLTGGRRTTVAPGSPRHRSQPGGSAAAAPSSRTVGAGGGPGSVRTTVPGEATRRKNDAGPAQRHAAHSVSSTSGGGGPQPSHDVRGRRSTPGCVATSVSTTQPRTERPWSGTRTRLPTPTSWPHSGGTA